MASEPVTKHCSVEQFVIVEIKRSQIKGAPYNPRTINDEAKKKLRDNLKRVGLLSPIVWNKRSGNVVSGHQRLTSLDIIMGKGEYTLNVAAVDLDDKTEKEQNIFFNNPDAMGDWDFDKLGELFKDGLDITATGFDAADVKDLFGGDSLSVDDLQSLSDRVEAAHKMEKKSAATNNSEQDNNFYLSMIFRDNATATFFAEWLGLNTESRYLDSRTVIGALASKLAQGGEIPEQLRN